jgi:hypothetical protein
MIRETSFHCWRDSERLMDSAKVVVHEIKGDRMTVIIQLLTKGVRESGKSMHRHPNREILAFHIASPDVLWVGVAPSCRTRYKPQVHIGGFPHPMVRHKPCGAWRRQHPRMTIFHLPVNGEREVCGRADCDMQSRRNRDRLAI